MEQRINSYCEVMLFLLRQGYTKEVMTMLQENMVHTDDWPGCAEAWRHSNALCGND